LSLVASLALRLRGRLCCAELSDRRQPWARPIARAAKAAKRVVKN